MLWKMFSYVGSQYFYRLCRFYKFYVFINLQILWILYIVQSEIEIRIIYLALKKMSVIFYDNNDLLNSSTFLLLVQFRSCVKIIAYNFAYIIILFKMYWIGIYVTLRIFFIYKIVNIKIVKVQNHVICEYIKN